MQNKNIFCLLFLAIFIFFQTLPALGEVVRVRYDHIDIKILILNESLEIRSKKINKKYKINKCQGAYLKKHYQSLPFIKNKNQWFKAVYLKRNNSKDVYFEYNSNSYFVLRGSYLGLRLMNINVDFLAALKASKILCQKRKDK